MSSLSNKYSDISTQFENLFISAIFFVLALYWTSQSGHFNNIFDWLIWLIRQVIDQLSFVDVVICICLMVSDVVQWSLPLPIATIAVNPASDVVAIFTQDAQREFAHY